jgi:DNA-directed RNA polymerase subunit N (RpoN/RPB10)
MGTDLWQYLRYSLAEHFGSEAAVPPELAKCVGARHAALSDLDRTPGTPGFIAVRMQDQRDAHEWAPGCALEGCRSACQSRREESRSAEAMEHPLDYRGFHKYCCQRHAANDMLPASTLGASEAPECALPGCSKPCWPLRNNEYHHWCCRSHAIEHRELHDRSLFETLEDQYVNVWPPYRGAPSPPRSPPGEASSSTSPQLPAPVQPPLVTANTLTRA